MELETGVRAVVEDFIGSAVEPALLDRGEEPLRLIAGQWELSDWAGRLTLQAWAGERNLTRRIVGLRERRSDRLVLLTERFPKLQAEMVITDLAAPDAREMEKRISRQAFRDRFALVLAREFPQWNVEEASSEPNLEESLSPAYVRAFLRRGTSGMAVIAAPPDSLDCAGAVPFGLIWLDYLRRREKRIGIRALLVFTPARREREIAFRVAAIDPARAECRVCTYGDKLRIQETDPADAGNADSTLPPCSRMALLAGAAAPEIRVPGVERIAHSDGSFRYEVRGAEFARWTGGKLLCGLGRKRRASMAEAESMARELARIRNSDAEDKQHPLYTQNPERWLEAQVRADPAAIDASLRATPVYGQAPIFAGADRGVVDLLGIDHTGRLAVIELKTSADVQLPFQALDYWLRVKKHLAAGDFERLGYFSGLTLRPLAPRILLVAPALEFHSTTETLIGYLKPEVEVTRIGLSGEWRKELKIVMRLHGAERP